MPRRKQSKDANLVTVRYLGPVCTLQLSDGPRVVATGELVTFTKTSGALDRLRFRGLIEAPKPDQTLDPKEVDQ